MGFLPADIRNLPIYAVSKELFISTSILLIILLGLGLVVTVTWIIRSCKHIYNYEYIPYHDFRIYREKKVQQIKVDDEEMLNQQQESEGKSSVYNEETQMKYKEFNRNQSRFLELICLSVVIVININAYSSKAFQLIAYAVALVVYFMFNILRIREKNQYLRLLFFIPLAVAFIPFYFPNKTLSNA